MDYLYCTLDLNSARGNREKIHNVLAGMSDRCRLNITPEPIKVRHFGGLDYYEKYRIYKGVRGIGGSSGRIHLQADEKRMTLSMCRNQQGQGFMKGHTYVYCHPAQMVLKSFSDRNRKK